MAANRFFLLLLFPILSGCNSYFYWPEPRLPIPKSYTGAGIQIHHFETADGVRLQGWHLPAKTEESKGLVVYCHGADTNLEEYLEPVEFLPYEGFDLFLFDYRGYGASEGRPSRKGTIVDTHAAIDYAKRIPLVRKPIVALLGYSLGAGIAIVTASERNDVEGVVAESGFTSYRAIGRKVAGDRWTTWILQFIAPVLISKGKDPVDHVHLISPRPLFIIHGDRDEIVPSWMGERLYERAKPPKKLWIVKGGTHYLPPADRHVEYERRVASFLEYILAKADGRQADIDPDCLPGSKLHD